MPLLGVLSLSLHTACRPSSMLIRSLLLTTTRLMTLAHMKSCFSDARSINSSSNASKEEMIRYLQRDFSVWVSATSYLLYSFLILILKTRYIFKRTWFCFIMPLSQKTGARSLDCGENNSAALKNQSETSTFWHRFLFLFPLCGSLFAAGLVCSQWLDNEGCYVIFWLQPAAASQKHIHQCQLWTINQHHLQDGPGDLLSPFSLVEEILTLNEFAASSNLT